LEDLSEAEKILEPFADSDSDIIIFEYTVIFEQYRFIYMAVSRRDLVREYAFKFAEYAIKGYQVSPSEINYIGLSIAYTVLAKASTKYDEKKEYFDKAIQIRKDIYQNQPISKNMNEYFCAVSQAAHFLSKSDAEGYLKECLRILESEEGDRVKWKYKYNVYQDEINYYCSIGKKNTALEKLAVLEKTLEGQKDKLTEEEYYKYLSRNFRKYATIYSGKGDYYKVIYYYEKENSVQYRLYKKFEADTDGDSFSESCYILALAYRHKKMFMRAVNYARQQIEIQEKAFNEFKSYAIMKRIMDAYQIMAEAYGCLQRDEDAINAYSKELQYAKMQYESNPDIKNLIKISSVYMLLEKYYIRRGDYDRLIDDYTELLQTLDTFDGTGDEQELNDLRNDIDYIKCMRGKIYYVTGTNLLKARAAIEASKCPYQDFTMMDREFYLGKIDSLLINDMVERYYPNEEEKKQIMDESVKPTGN
jgi:tetratricopeptide (TPR) repeat protein